MGIMGAMYLRRATRKKGGAEPVATIPEEGAGLNKVKESIKKVHSITKYPQYPKGPIVSESSGRILRIL
jgi:hypothetical protein